MRACVCLFLFSLGFALSVWWVSWVDESQDRLAHPKHAADGEISKVRTMDVLAGVFAIGQGAVVRGSTSSRSCAVTVGTEQAEANSAHTRIRVDLRRKPRRDLLSPDETNC
ncbi:hypothetical protein BCV70DRAFT_103283 [Testicularia cyperi]|uniref:Secreted protein n=1 Tax=Testicularia cyperi TaxID=1882483 RepID=A0A317XQ03_9BASI|nr:hypothetical protein BCV70DRAFT_103283 [Testicularia cyperi]